MAGTEPNGNESDERQTSNLQTANVEQPSCRRWSLTLPPFHQFAGCSIMSDDDSSNVSSSDDSQLLSLLEFDAGFRIVRADGSSSISYLKDLHDLQHVPGEELDQLLPEEFNHLVLDGHANPESKEYRSILHLLHSSRRWRSIELSNIGPRMATPESLSLVVLVPTKTNTVELKNCPMDLNFFACLNSGMQTLTHVTIDSSTIRISFDAAAMCARGLALSRSLESLKINDECMFEPGAALKMAEGIKRNKSLKHLAVEEENLGTAAMVSILRAVSEGCLPKLVTSTILLNNKSGCPKYLTKLMSSDTCSVEALTISANSTSTIFRTDDVPIGTTNLKLKSLLLRDARFDKSYFTRILLTMPTISEVTLNFCDISDITPIVDHLCRPNTAVKTIDLHMNNIGIDQAEKFVRFLPDMQSLTDVDISGNTWDDDPGFDEERVKKILQKVSMCWNLEKFYFRNYRKRIQEQDLNQLALNLATNRAWRRELCFKKSSPPSKFLPLIIARALRKTKDELRADVVLSLLRERISDLMPIRND